MVSCRESRGIFSGSTYYVQLSWQMRIASFYSNIQLMRPSETKSTHQNWSEINLSGVLSSDLGGAALSRSLSSSSSQRSDRRVGRRRCAVAFLSETKKYSRLADANRLSDRAPLAQRGDHCVAMTMKINYD